jgi:hypothetical protein
MEKITIKALELAGFENAQTIAKILQFTPNPRVATEMILGIYNPITIEEFGHIWKSKYSSEEFLISVTKVDELGDTVSFCKYQYKTKEVYYLTKEDKENFVFEKPKDYYTSGSKRTTGYVVTSETVSMEVFCSRYVKSDQDLHDWMIDASEYVNPLLQQTVLHEDIF